MTAAGPLAGLRVIELAGVSLLSQKIWSWMAQEGWADEARSLARE
jgi:hypothetical protein